MGFTVELTIGCSCQTTGPVTDNWTYKYWFTEFTDFHTNGLIYRQTFLSKLATFLVMLVRLSVCVFGFLDLMLCLELIHRNILYFKHSFWIFFKEDFNFLAFYKFLKFIFCKLKIDWYQAQLQAVADSLWRLNSMVE